MGISAAMGSLASKPGVCTSTTRPVTPHEGQLIFETDTDSVAFWDGSYWRYLEARKNLLYNGAMQVAQRGTLTASITSSGYYTADRWKTFLGGLGTWTQSVENDTPTGSGFRKSVKMLCTSADASPAAGDFLGLHQLIEGQDLQSIAKGAASAKQVTISFWVKSNVTGTYIFELVDNDNSRTIHKTYTISTSGTWEFKSLTIDADTTGAFDNDNALSLEVNWWLGAGSTYSSGTLNTIWASYSAANRAVGQTNLASATNNYWQITGIQLNIGALAAPFEFKTYEQELQECKRYYWRCVDPAGVGVADSNARCTRTLIPFHTEMRAAPTSVVSGTLNFWNGVSTGTATGLIGTFNTKNHGQLDFNGGTGSTTGVNTLYTTGGSQYIEFLSEL